MEPGDLDSLATLIRTLPPGQLARFSEWAEGLAPGDVDLVEAAAALRADTFFPSARPKQQPPPGDWRIWLILSGRGFGKALALDTPIPTPTGWTTMREIRPGDEVLGVDGRPTEVLAAHEIRYDRDCYEVRFNDGARIIADGEHLWRTSTHAARKAAKRRADPAVGRWPECNPQIRTTVEIARTLTIGTRGDRNHSVEIAAALKLPEADLPIDPYVLGYWLGDGSSAAAEITIGDTDAEIVLRLLADCGEPVTGPVRRSPHGRCATYPIGGAPQVRDHLGRIAANGSLHSRLRILGVLRNKHIPAAYLRASADQRRALLAGLMDSDGSASRYSVELTLTNKRLAFDAYELVISLGWRATIAESDARLNGRTVGRRWRLTFRPLESVFRLPRKADRLYPPGAQRSRHTHRMIVAVAPVPSVPVRCITVAAADGLFLAGLQMIPTHNSRTGAEWVVDEATEQVGEYAVLAENFAKGRDICFEGQGDNGGASGILSVLRRRGRDDEAQSWNRSLGEVRLANGSMLKLMSAEKPDGPRGWNLAGSWCDEVSSWRYPETFDQLLLALRIGERPRVVITTTPKPTVLLRSLVAQERDGDETVVITRGSTWENAENLSAFALAELERRYGGSRLGRQELEGELLEDVEGALWRRSWIDQARVGDAPQDGLIRTVVAVDPAVTSSETSDETGIIAAARTRPKYCPACGPVDAPHAFILEDRSCRESPDRWAARAVRLYDDVGADRLVAEKNQGYDLVEGVIRNVQRGISYEGVQAKKGKALRAGPASACYEQGRVHHVGSFPELEDQLTSWDPLDGQDSPDRLDALVYALAALSMWPQAETTNSARAAAARTLPPVARPSVMIPGIRR